jgi:type IV secretory pathway VirB10-like protein
MTTATFTNPPVYPDVVRLRTRRLALLLLLLLAVLAGGGFWLLSTHGKKVSTAPVTQLVQPSWIKEAVAYAPEERGATQAAAAALDPTAALRHELAALRQEVQAQRAAETVRARRPAAAPAAAPAPRPAPKPHGSMLFVSHDLKEPPAGPKASEYTLAPGATKLPCILETKIISDVEGHFTCRVTTNVYDTATGRHLLVPQGSVVLGNDQANTLVYGSNRMDTVSLTLTLPDGRSVDLGRAPVTDQQGVAGLTGDVNNHYVKLFGAVLIGGALKGGISAFQIAATEAAGAGQVASGLTNLGNQATTKAVQPYINIRPTITIEAGQVAHVILLKPLHLPAMWQGGDPHDTRTTRRER